MKVDCRFYHEDTFRGRTVQGCRLIGRNPDSEPWKPKLCQHCPVPRILRENPCAYLALEGRVGKRLRFFPRVEIYAVCTAKLKEISDPATCWRGCERFKAG